MTFDDTPHTNDFFVSSEPHLLDLTWVTNALLGTYWGSWRTHELIADSIKNSLCFGLYERENASANRQVGFLRAVTDYAVFTEICDVFIDPTFRRRGLGRFLVDTAMHDPRIAKTVMHLATRDAHELYAKLGFEPVKRMRRIPR